MLYSRQKEKHSGLRIGLLSVNNLSYHDNFLLFIRLQVLNLVRCLDEMEFLYYLPLYTLYGIYILYSRVKADIRLAQECNYPNVSFNDQDKELLVAIIKSSKFINQFSETVLLGLSG